MSDDLIVARPLPGRPTYTVRAQPFERLLRQRDRIAQECERYGLPHSVEALLRHIYNNRDCTFAVKDLTIENLRKDRDRLAAAAAAALERAQVDTDCGEIEMILEQVVELDGTIIRPKDPS